MISEKMPLFLGSASPRRRELLATLMLPIRWASVDVDESTTDGEPAQVYLERVTAAKLQAALRVPEAQHAGAVLVADTAVLVDGLVLGKPRDAADARSMIRALSGREHQVCTRFSIAGSGAIYAETVTTAVVFRALEEEEIEAYVATGEGSDKAGAYAIQGIGAFAVARISGSWSNVVGLPICEVVLALRKMGLLGRFPLAPAHS